MFNLQCDVKQEERHDDRPRSFLIYAPSRTAVVYALQEDTVKAIDAEISSSSIETLGAA